MGNITNYKKITIVDNHEPGRLGYPKGRCVLKVTKHVGNTEYVELENGAIIYVVSKEASLGVYELDLYYDEDKTPADYSSGEKSVVEYFHENYPNSLAKWYFQKKATGAEDRRILNFIGGSDIRDMRTGNSTQRMKFSIMDNGIYLKLNHKQDSQGYNNIHLIRKF